MSAEVKDQTMPRKLRAIGLVVLEVVAGALLFGGPLGAGCVAAVAIEGLGATTGRLTPVAGAADGPAPGVAWGLALALVGAGVPDA